MPTTLCIHIKTTHLTNTSPTIMFPLTYQLPPMATTSLPSSSPQKPTKHPPEQQPAPPSTPTTPTKPKTLPPPPQPDLTHGFTSPAYTARSPTSPIVLEPVRYNPIAPDEIVLTTSAVGICASDLKAAAGKFHGVSPPMILGHECSGVVAAVGEQVMVTGRLKVGDKVVLSYDGCGRCGMCVKGERAYCGELVGRNLSGVRFGEGGKGVSRYVGSVTVRRERDKKGEGGSEIGDDWEDVASGDWGEDDEERMPIKGHFFGQSSMGRMIVARESCAVRVADDTTEQEMRIFASLGCGIQTGVGAILNVAKPAPNSSICIFGAGSVGLATCLAARLTSPKKLVVVDNSAAKLLMLPECITTAATDLVDSSKLTEESQFVDKLKSLTDDGIGFDYVLDCVGRGELVRAGHLALRPRGSIIVVGGSPDMALQVSLSQHLAKGITCRGTHQGDSIPTISIPLMIDLWRQGKFPFDQLLSFYNFTELEKSIQEMRGGRAIKPVLVNQ